MKFPGKGKKEEASRTHDPTHGLPQMPSVNNKEALRRIKEMEKKKAKPTPCPYIGECEFLMLPQIGEMVCLDQEVGVPRRNQAYMAHMHGHHVWEQCREMAQRKRKAEGVLPRDLKKVLKKQSKGK